MFRVLLLSTAVGGSVSAGSASGPLTVVYTWQPAP